MKEKFRFNWVDAVIILLVIAVAVVGFVYLKGRNKVAGAQTQKLYFVFETDPCSEAAAEQWTVGTQVVFGTKNVDKGTITAAEVVPYTQEAADTASGVWKMNDVPGQYQARVTIAFDGFESDNAYSSSTEQLTVGLGTVVDGKGVNSEGYILDIGEMK